MGCCYSSSSIKEPHNHREGDSPLTKFSFSDLNTATENFSSQNIVSDSKGEYSDIVYMGRLQNRGLVAVKKFKNMTWPDPNQFSEEAKRIGNLKHKRVVNLIGYCCDENERLLVAEFLPNDNLAKRLFQQSGQTMEWTMRLRVAYYIAEALDCCRTEGFASYNNLSAYTILFDQDGDACLSCFGLMKKKNNDQRTTGSVDTQSVIFRFGTVLVELLCGKQIPPSHALEMIQDKNVVELIDPNLKGIFSPEEATIVFKLASQCLHYKDIESLNTKDLVTSLEALQTKTKVSLNEMLEMTKENSESSTQVTSLREACLRMDLTEVHKILVMEGYKDDKEVFECSFDEWTQEVKDLQVVREHGDQAFLEQDFETSINCYSQYTEARRIVYPSVYARRSLCYLVCNQPERALRDGMLAQQVFTHWPTAFYMQSMALLKLNMVTDSADTFKEAALLEAKRQRREGES